MTEDEAKIKWCPQMGIMMAIEAITGNADGRAQCIASDCMMWVSTDDTLRNTGAEPGIFPSGYCGLSASK